MLPEPPLEVGSEAWCQLRDERTKEWFLDHPGPIAFIHAMGAFVELWDDLIDKDKEIPDEEINGTFIRVLLDIACNRWFIENAEYLSPLVVQMISAYFDSEELKDDKDIAKRQVAFHLRNYMLEFYHACAFLVGGYNHLRSVGPEIRRFFAFETFEDWEHG